MLCLSIAVGVLSGGDPHHAFERTDKMRIVGKTHDLSYLLHRDVLPQQFPGLEDAQIDDVFVEAETGHILEQMAQVELAHIKLLGEAVQGDGVLEILLHIGQNGLHFVEAVLLNDEMIPMHMVVQEAKLLGICFGD